MIIGILSILLSLGQTQLRDAGPAPSSGDRNVRHAIIPGKVDVRLKPIDGFSCRSFLGYAEVQTFMNLLQGDTSCSGEVLDQQTGSFRQVNYLPTPAGLLAVVIHSPRDRVDAKSRIVIFLTGGPRTVAVTRPLAKEMVAKGYTVLMPIYLGQLETRHPNSDLPGAIEQVEALTRWANTRLVAYVGVSTGAYLAAAACVKHCAPRVLLAPPLTTPEDLLSDKRVDWSKLHNGYCLWRHNGSEKVCADDQPFIKSFWGEDHYRRKLTDLLKGQCDRVRIVVSPADKRVYDPRGVANLRAVGCKVETPAGYEHSQIDENKMLNDHTLELIAQQNGTDRSNR